MQDDQTIPAQHLSCIVVFDCAHVASLVAQLADTGACSMVGSRATVSQRPANDALPHLGGQLYLWPPPCHSSLKFAVRLDMSSRRSSHSGAAVTPPGGSGSASLTPGGRRRSVTPRKALRIEEQHELQGLNGRLESYGKFRSLQLQRVGNQFPHRAPSVRRRDAQWR